MDSDNIIKFKTEIECRPELRQPGENINNSLARHLRAIADSLENGIVNNGEKIAIHDTKHKRVGFWTFADPNAKYVVYWRGGKHEVIVGETFDAAFRNSGYGGGAVAAVDFFEHGEIARFKWDNQKREWLIPVSSSEQMNETRV